MYIVPEQIPDNDDVNSPFWSPDPNSVRSIESYGVTGKNNLRSTNLKAVLSEEKLSLMPCLKLRSEMNRTKVSHKILLMKSSGNHFIFLPVFYLIM